MNDTAEDCVKRGAELLDTLMPGWAALVDIDLLTFEGPQGFTRCVLGQVYGGFEKGTRAVLSSPDHNLFRLGFNSQGVDGTLDEILVPPWTAEIEKRRHA